MKNAKRAFTLVEIMIVVLIIGILLAIAVPNFIRAREQSRAKACSSNLKQIDSAKEQYAMDKKLNSDYSFASIAPLWTSGATSTNYLKSEPLCPSSGVYTVGNVSTDPSCDKSTTNYPHTVTGL